ncbi:hypothetical protein HNR44_000950 [Geomicrobium halophilum]|uniref:Uncharacterized protein n=1 Tax=Geomicrobium halophilum TaxID=549000 RepID=A0A841PRT4_9BACL|nr:hypothetical protein [Geomicrobium halophilum]MBB6449001.1 hypothetical protein [Geomicrobium halophilum]
MKRMLDYMKRFGVVLLFSLVLLTVMNVLTIAIDTDQENMTTWGMNIVNPIFSSVSSMILN